MRCETKVNSEGFIRQDQFALQGKNSDSGHFSLCWGGVKDVFPDKTSQMN